MTEPQYTSPRLCRAPGCTTPAVHQRTLCALHRWRTRRFGSFDRPLTEDETMNEGERWLPVVGWEGIYVVSDYGRVRRLREGKGIRSGRDLAGSDNKGYRAVSLNDKGRSERWMVHRLVARAFIGAIPEGYQVNHIDFNRANNHLSNLEIVTSQVNTAHTVLHKRHPHGTTNGTAILDDLLVELIRCAVAGGMSAADVAFVLGINRWTVANVVQGRNWKHVG